MNADAESCLKENLNASRPSEHSPSCFSHSACVCCVLSFHLFWTSGLWTYQPGSHRRKVTQDFSTFLLRCLSFFSREGFSRSFPSSTVKSIFLRIRPFLTLSFFPIGNCLYPFGRKNPCLTLSEIGNFRSDI